MEALSQLIQKFRTPLIVGGALAVLVVLGLANQARIGSIYAAVTNTPVLYAISPNTVYSHLPATQTHLITGQNLRTGDWSTNCELNDEVAPADSFYVGVYDPVDGGGGIFVARMRLLGLASYKQMQGTNEQFELIVTPNQDLPLKNFDKFYASKCNSGLYTSGTWRGSTPVAPFVSTSDDLNVKSPVDITTPETDDELVVGKSYPITARINTANFGGAASVYIEYHLKPIPAEGENITQEVRKIGETAPFTLQTGTQDFTWVNAGYYNSSSVPWEGDAQIIGYLKRASDGSDLTTFSTGIFELYRPTLTVTQPAAGSSTTYFWGEANKTVKFVYRGDSTHARIYLSKLTQTSGGPLVPDLTLMDACPVAYNAEATCQFNIPAKPDTHPNGSYLLRVVPLASEGDYALPNFNWRSVEMKDAVDLTFDKAHGVKGFVISPVAQVAGVGKEVNVKIAIKNTTSTPLTQDFELQYALRFGAGNLPGPQTKTVSQDVGELTLVDLGNFAYPEATLSDFNIKLDTSGQVEEIDETEASNVYASTEVININDYLTSAHLGFEADRQTGALDSANLTNKETMILRASVGGQTKLSQANLKIHYDEDKLNIGVADIHPATENQLEFATPPTIADGLITLQLRSTETAGLTGADKALVKLDFHAVVLNQNDTASVWINFEATSQEDDINLYSQAPGFIDQDITTTLTGSPRAIVVSPVFVSDLLPLEATYLSKKFVVVAGAQTLNNLNSLKAIYNDEQVQNATNYTKVAIAFFNAQGVNVGVGKVGFENGFYPLILTTSGAEVDLTGLKASFGSPWIASITSVQYQIVMRTQDNNDANLEQPWVQNLTLKYTTDQLGEIGTITGPTTLSVDANGETTQTYTIQRYVQESFIGRVQLSLIPTGGTTPPQVSFVTPDPSGLIDITNSSPITVRVKFKDTGATEGEIIPLSFRGTAVDDSTQSLLPLAVQFSVGEGEPSPCGDTPCPEGGVQVTIKAPFEGAMGAVHPSFTFRLNTASDLKALEQTGIKLDTQNQATISLGNFAAGTYKPYLRSTRHLWRAASTQLTVIAGTQTYALEFDQLISGDIDPNNTINVLDFSTYAFDWGKSLPNLLPDFDENGSVNSLDAVNIFYNYFKVGSPVTD